MILTFQLIRGERAESYADFKSRIFQQLEQLVADPAIEELKVTLTEEQPPNVSVVPFEKDKIAAIRIGWADGKVGQPLESSAGSFVVHEDLPVSYQRNWKLRQPTPGACLLTLFRQKKDIPYDTFIQRWHQEHTPLSLKIHPLWHYSRNVVKDQWGTQGIWYDGIVEEHFDSRKKLMNPAPFFGGVLSMLPNMLRVYLHVNTFLDYSSIKSYLVTEYYLKEQVAVSK